jgi:hypothetical protein
MAMHFFTLLTGSLDATGIFYSSSVARLRRKDNVRSTVCEGEGVDRCRKVEM